MQTQDHFNYHDKDCNVDCIFEMTDSSENYLQGLFQSNNNGPETYALFNQKRDRSTAILWTPFYEEGSRFLIASIIDTSGNKFALTPNTLAKPGSHVDDPQLLFTTGKVPSGAFKPRLFVLRIRSNFRALLVWDWLMIIGIFQVTQCTM